MKVYFTNSDEHELALPYGLADLFEAILDNAPVVTFDEEDNPQVDPAAYVNHCVKEIHYVAGQLRSADDAFEPERFLHEFRIFAKPRLAELVGVDADELAEIAP